jgi:hypothetical protein
MVSIVLRRHIPILIIWSLFLILTGNYFFDIGLGAPTSFLKNAAIVITSFTILVGCASYVIRSISRLSNWRKETRLNLSYELFWWVVFLTFLTVAATRGLTSEIFVAGKIVLRTSVVWYMGHMRYADGSSNFSKV